MRFSPLLFFWKSERRRAVSRGSLSRAYTISRERVLNQPTFETPLLSRIRECVRRKLSDVRFSPKSEDVFETRVRIATAPELKARARVQASVFLGGKIAGYETIPNLDIVTSATVTRLVLDQARRVEDTSEDADSSSTFRATESSPGDRCVVALEMALGADAGVLLSPGLKDDTAPPGLEDAAPPLGDASSLLEEDAHLVVRRQLVLLKKDAVVVLAGGAVLTPHLLMRSGVGPVAQLERAKVPLLVRNEGVGVGLQDHPAVGVVFDVAPALTADMAGLYGRFLNWTRGEPFGSYSRAFGYPGFSAGAFFDSGVRPVSQTRAR